MTAPESPVIFDAATGTPLPDVPERGTLLVAYTPGAREDGWAPDAALALARGLREDGRRVFLCDVALEDPQLHRVAGVENAEGMSDALRYGTSFRRVAHRIEGNLFVAPAGTVAVDAGALRDDPRWETFTGGFADAGALLVLYGPVDGESMDRLANRATSIVVLAAPGEDFESALPDHAASAVLLRGDREDPAAAVSDDADVAATLDWDEPADPLAAVDAGTAVHPPEVDAAEGEDDEVVDVADLMPEAADPVAWSPDDLAPDDPAPDEPGIDGEASSEPSGNEEFDPAAAEEDEEVLEVADLMADDSDDPLDFADPLGAVDAGTAAPPAHEDGLGEGGVPTVEPPIPAPIDDSADEEPIEVIDLTPEAEIPVSAEELVEAVANEPDADPLTAAPPPDGVEDTLEAPAPGYDTPVVAPGREEGSKGSAGRLLVLLLLVVVAVLAAAWFGVIEIPGLPLSSADASEPAEELSAVPPAVGPATDPPAPASAGVPEPQAEVAAFVVALAAFPDESTALEEQSSWASLADDVQFVVAPVEVNDRPWYRLMAGPATDSASALEIADRLRSAADVAGDDWIVREARLAFLLGETRGRDAADQRVSVLSSLGIPAHVLRVPYSDGSESFRVYAGAYASEAEAAYLEGLLREQDITNAPLTERLGSLSE